ncbi:MAG: alpha/beta hydrolase fold domain-containing protein [Bacteroidales bacterium]|nr:alpha/beta hydrolase fold domain-containing protein [Bacteroidales bacterium]
MKRHTLLLSLILLLTLSVKAQTAKKFTINLSADNKSNVVCFLPEKPSGKAIVGVPGGGYSMLSNTHEGTDWSNWLNQKGIAYFVVNYRLPNGDRTLPISDVENTFRIVRDSAKAWNINPHDVGIMGFSAGGHLSSVISTHSEFEVRPDFTILFYPVISMDEKISHKWSCINFLGEEGHKNPELVKEYSTQNAVKRHLTPPALIIMASDDRLVPPVTNGIQYYSAMRNQGNECSMFIYPTGDHGFGIGPWFKYHDQMLNDLSIWLDNRQTPKPGALRVACIGNSITDGHGIDVATQHGYPALLQKNLGEDYWVKNFGLSGRTLLNNGDIPYMKELAWRDALAFKPDVVVIKLGTNDSKPQNWQHKDEFKRDLQQMIISLRPDLMQSSAKKKGKKSTPAPNANPKIYICTPIHALKPSWDINDDIISNEIIPIQKEVAKEYGLEIIDLNTLFGSETANYLDDGIHPNEKGAKRMSDLIFQAISKK